MRTVVLDTNVLLSEPSALLAFPDAEVVIPETVLGELDKIKTSRVDPELRFKGREASRILFELSEQGPLLTGVDLPNGGRLRVVTYDSDMELPEGLSPRNADDRILAVAYNMCDRGCRNLTVVTNDLNMLLKAQTLGIQVERRADESEAPWAKRYIIRPFQRYRVPISVLAIAVAVFAAAVVIALYGRGTIARTTLPAEFRQVLTTQQLRIYDLLLELESGTSDTTDSHRQLGDIYYDLMQTATNTRQANVYANLAIEHYNSVLEREPKNHSVRTDLASVFYNVGSVDRAISETQRVLEADPEHIQANFNLGIFYWRGRKDFAAAESQFEKVIELTADGDAVSQAINQSAKERLQQVREDATRSKEPTRQGGDT